MGRLWVEPQRKHAVGFNLQSRCFLIYQVAASISDFAFYQIILVFDVVVMQFLPECYFIIALKMQENCMRIVYVNAECVVHHVKLWAYYGVVLFSYGHFNFYNLCYLCFQNRVQIVGIWK